MAPWCRFAGSAFILIAISGSKAWADDQSVGGCANLVIQGANVTIYGGVDLSCNELQEKLDGTDYRRATSIATDWAERALVEQIAFEDVVIDFPFNIGGQLFRNEGNFRRAKYNLAYQFSQHVYDRLERYQIPADSLSVKTAFAIDAELLPKTQRRKTHQPLTEEQRGRVEEEARDMMRLHGIADGDIVTILNMEDQANNFNAVMLVVFKKSFEEMRMVGAHLFTG